MTDATDVSVDAFAAAPATAGTGIEVVGGAPAVVLAVFVLLGITSVLSLLVTYRFALGYLATRTRPLLLLAVGMCLLTAAPTAVRLAFANVTSAPGAYRTVAASGLELLGLLTILYTIVDR